MKIFKTIMSILIMVFAFSLLACSDKDKEKENMNIDIVDGVMIRNGVEYKTYQLLDGETGVITMKINKTSGIINIDVYNVNNKNNHNYTGRDIDLNLFTVNVSEGGEYQICIECSSFVGEYEINWKTEKTN